MMKVTVVYYHEKINIKTARVKKIWHKKVFNNVTAIYYFDKQNLVIQTEPADGGRTLAPEHIKSLKVTVREGEKNVKRKN